MENRPLILRGGDDIKKPLSPSGSNNPKILICSFQNAVISVFSAVNHIDAVAFHI